MRHRVTGETYCWGFSYLGETGSTAYGETVTVPNKVPGGGMLVSLGAGDSFTCGMTTAGRAYCWGAGDRGNSAAQFRSQLGRRVLELLLSDAGVGDYVSDLHSRSPWATATGCGLTPSNVAECWGDNGQGQPGTEVTYAEPRVGLSRLRVGSPGRRSVASGPVTCGTPSSGPQPALGLVPLRHARHRYCASSSRRRRLRSPAALLFTRFALSDKGTSVRSPARVRRTAGGSGRYGQLGTGELLP